MTRRFVYFAQSGNGGPIKIGQSVRPEQRIAALNTGSAETIALLAVIPDQGRTEAHLHQVFADSRLHGEWFADTPELVDLIAAIVAPDLSVDSHRELHALIASAA